MGKTQPYTPQSLGQRIAHARRLLGVREGKDVSVPELAKRVGVTSESVYNWEADVTEPGKANKNALAAELGVTPKYLDYGEETIVDVQPMPKPTSAAVRRPPKGRASGE